MGVGERIKEIRGNETVASFCNKLGIHRNTLPRYESGDRNPDAAFLEAICRHYNVSPTWLLLGEGPKELQPHEVDGQVDMMKDIYFDDPEAIKRRQHRVEEQERLLKLSREKFTEIFHRHRLEHLPKPTNETEKQLISAIRCMKELLKTELFSRLNAEHKADELATLVHSPTTGQADQVNIQELLNMTAEVLVSNTTYRPALSANIKAFHRSITMEKDNQNLLERVGAIEEKLLKMEEKHTDDDDDDSNPPEAEAAF